MGAGKSYCSRRFGGATCDDKSAQIYARFDKNDWRIQPAEFYRFHDARSESGSAGMPRPISYAVFCLKKRFVIVSIFIPKLRLILILNSFFESSDNLVFLHSFPTRRSSDLSRRFGGATCDDKSAQIYARFDKNDWRIQPAEFYRFHDAEVNTFGYF